jgi:hypothetical protein
MKFEYGSKVKVTDTAPLKWKLASFGWVVGYREVDSEEVAAEFKQQIGTGIYLIEFEDYPRGIEIPEPYISASSQTEGKQ